MKTLLITFISLAAFAILIATLKHNGILLTYQISVSMPRGFYLIFPAKNIHRGDIVVFAPPPPIIEFLKQHEWAPSNGHLMKIVVATAGDNICKRSGAVWINEKRFAPVYDYYAPKRLLPNTPFCETLSNHHYLLMSTLVPHSFDGRYFGPVDENAIIGKAKRIL